MQEISRRDFTAKLAGVPFITLGAMNTRAGVSLGTRQLAAVERILRRFIDSNIVPGVSYSIGNARETLAEGAFGLRTARPAAPMESTTRCALASVSKQFAAAAAYLLQQRNVLSLDAPVSKYITGLKYGREITLRQLLTMRSGVPMNDEECEMPMGGKLNKATLIANLNKHKLDFAPGHYFAYSNCAYDLAGLVIAAVSRMSYADFIEQNFFKALSMGSSYMLLTRDDLNFAQGYVREANGWKLEAATTIDAAFASGNLVSTPGDMQRWDRSLLNATVLSRKTLQEMFTVPTGGPHFHYASGWFVEPSGVIWHGGTLAGYATVNMLIPATDHAIVLLSNTAPSEKWKPQDVAREIYNAAALGPALPSLLPRVRTTAPK